MEVTAGRRGSTRDGAGRCKWRFRAAASTVIALAVVAPAVATAMTIVATPSALHLGEDAGATLRVEGAPAGVRAEDLELLASTGRVVKVAAASAGFGFTARYEPPPERAPSVAVVAALVRGRTDIEPAWTAIPLWGRTAIAVATEPGAGVTIEISGETYGPFRAPRAGRFEKSFAVPPGVRSVTVRTVDALGNARTDAVALDPPPFAPGLLLAWTVGPVRAGTGGAVELVALLVGDDGAPRKTPPELEVGGGSGEVLPPTTPGVYRVRVTPTATPFGGTLSVRLPAGSSIALEWRAEILPSAPARVALEAPAELSAGAEVTLSIHVLTAEGAPLAAIAPWIAVTTTWGEVSVVREEAPGVYRAHYRGGGKLPARAEVRLEAVVTPPSGVAARAEARRPARSGPAVRLEPTIPAPVVSGRHAAVALRVAARDADGNPVEGLVLSARLPRTDARGAAEARLDPVAGAPGFYGGALALPGARPGTLEVDVSESGGLAVRVPIELAAAAGRWRGALGAGLLAGWNGADATSAGLTLHASAGTGRVVALSLGGALHGLWARASDGAGAGTTLGLDGALLEALGRVAADVRWGRWRVGLAIEGGVALLLGRVRARGSAGDGGEPRVASLAPALHAAASAGLRAGPGFVFVAAGWALRPLPAGGAIAGDLGGPELAFGWELER